MQGLSAENFFSRFQHLSAGAYRIWAFHSPNAFPMPRKNYRRERRSQAIFRNADRTVTGHPCRPKCLVKKRSPICLANLLSSRDRRRPKIGLVGWAWEERRPAYHVGAWRRARDAGNGRWLSSKSPKPQSPRPCSNKRRRD